MQAKNNSAAVGCTTPPRSVTDNDTDDLAEIDLVGLVTAVLRRWKLCAAMCGVMIVAGLAYCFMVPTQYQTVSRVFVDTAQLKTTPKDEVQFVLSRQVLQKVFDDFKYGETKPFAGDAEALKHFRKLYDVKEVPKTALIEIAFKDPDAARSAAVNAATAQSYIKGVRDRVRRVLMSEQTVLQTLLSQREKERTEAAGALEAFKTKHGILALDVQRRQTVDDLDRVAATVAAADAAVPLLNQSGSSRLTYAAQPIKNRTERARIEKEQENLRQELVRLDALALEYQRINDSYNTAQSAYLQAFNAVQTQTALIERVNSDALARVAVPASTDDDFVKKQPAKVKIMAIIALASIVLSVLVCVVLELLDRTVNTRREFERLSGLVVLAEVDKAVASEVGSWQKTAALLGMETDGAGKALVFVKPSALTVMPEVCLAAALAQTGKKVLLAVDPDEAEQLTANGVSMTKSQTVIEGVMCRSAVVRKTAFAICETSASHVATRLPALEEHYDLVLMAAAPLAVSVGSLKAAATAGVKTVIVGELYRTESKDLTDAVQLLDRVRASGVGAILLRA